MCEILVHCCHAVIVITVKVITLSGMPCRCNFYFQFVSHCQIRKIFGTDGLTIIWLLFLNKLNLNYVSGNLII